MQCLTWSEQVKDSRGGASLLMCPNPSELPPCWRGTCWLPAASQLKASSLPLLMPWRVVGVPKPSSARAGGNKCDLKCRMSWDILSQFLAEAKHCQQLMSCFGCLSSFSHVNTIPTGLCFLLQDVGLFMGLLKTLIVCVPLALWLALVAVCRLPALPRLSWVIFLLGH